MLYFFRWVFNFIFNAIPWFWFSLGMVVINIVSNIVLNNLWAGGNLGLILNTWYLIFQTLHSWILVVEVPFLLKLWPYTVLRWFSVLSAVFYIGF